MSTNFGANFDPKITVIIGGYADDDTIVEIPATLNGKPVVGISHYAFEGHTNLQEIILPDTLVFIEDYAFDGCTGLTSVTIPKSCTSIGKNAFHGCTNLKQFSVG